MKQGSRMINDDVQRMWKKFTKEVMVTTFTRNDDPDDFIRQLEVLSRQLDDIAARVSMLSANEFSNEDPAMEEF